MDELQYFLLGEENWGFLPEVVLRSFIGFVAVIIAIKLTGKRGVKQLSLFELVIILTLGSAAGDIAFYKDVGVFAALTTIAAIILLYRLVTYLQMKSSTVGRWIEGRAITIIRNGKFSDFVIKNEHISFDEFYMELRQCGVEHLGQVRVAVLEVDGNITVFRNEGEELIAGLCILPDVIGHLYRTLPEDGLYSCVHCGYTDQYKQDEEPVCTACGHDKWGKASTRGVIDK